MNIADNLVRSAADFPDKVALRLGESDLTYAQFEAGSQRVAGLLAEHGVGPGDRVGLMLPNVPQFGLLYYGALRCGAVVVPMNPLLKEREVAYYLRDSGTRVMFVWDGFRDEAIAGAEAVSTPVITVSPADFAATLAAAEPRAEVLDREPSDAAVILYTSGTTGQPKGAELTHGSLSRNIEICVSDLIGVTSDDIIFGGLPLFHVFGQTCGLNTAVKAGACLTLLPRFDATDALALLQSNSVTVFEGVPTMYVALANHPQRDDYNLSKLRICVSGGAAMPVEVMSTFEKAFGCDILEGYGLSETSPVASFNFRGRKRAGSIGVPVAGVEFRLVDDEGADVAAGEPGEIAIRGHNVMKGYWGRPEETDKAIRGGWFHTGDIGRVDDDGFYYVVDRKKEMIIRGGYNVYPREVEEVLYEHPAVNEAAVIGVPHAELGEEVAAVVALRPGATATPEELKEFVKARVAAYKYPRTVHLVEALPKGPTGKILKREISIPENSSLRGSS